MLNIELMPSNLTSLHPLDYTDTHTDIILFSNLYHCIEDRTETKFIEGPVDITVDPLIYYISTLLP